jgi:hypothetical protein
MADGEPFPVGPRINACRGVASVRDSAPAITTLPVVQAVRYAHAVREGGSLPGLAVTVTPMLVAAFLRRVLIRQRRFSTTSVPPCTINDLTTVAETRRAVRLRRPSDVPTAVPVQRPGCPLGVGTTGLRTQ